MGEKLIQLLRRHLEAENAHDMDATLATLTSDCRFEDVALGSYRGHEGASQYYRLWWDAFDTEVSPEGLHDTGGPFVVAENALARAPRRAIPGSGGQRTLHRRSRRHRRRGA